MITLKIDVSKILKEHLFQGKTGKYLDLCVFESKAIGQYGDTHYVVQGVSKEVREAMKATGERMPIIGNGKEFGSSPPSSAISKPKPMLQDVAEDDFTF